MNQIDSLIADLNRIKNENHISDKDTPITVINEHKLNKLKTKEKQLKEDIEREITDLLDFIELKKVGIEVLNSMSKYITSEIADILEQDKRVSSTQSNNTLSKSS